MTAPPSTLKCIVYSRLMVAYRNIGREIYWNKWFGDCSSPDVSSLDDSSLYLKNNSV